ncbi:MAG: DDE-type integrase/transposase/recombinase [Planctomycetes bacterium]|nr:DDE-type integrase/transposase/recombinase [Planctomycetota bacterium]
MPRATAAGWVRRAPAAVLPVGGLDATPAALRIRIARLEKRLRRLTAVLRLVLALLRLLRPDMARLRVPRASDKSRLLRAIDRSRGVLGLRRVLGIAGLSPSRLGAWRRAARACDLEDALSCPRSSPQRLTDDEVAEARAMATAPAFRHVPTGRLAVLAQRLGRVVASPTTWLRLARERGWRRPRARVHPAAPREGIRARRPDEVWHVDTTVIRLLDGSRVHLQAVIDNFSRRILSWRLLERFEPGVTAALLVEAGRQRGGGGGPPMLLADAGVENRTGAVDALVESGLLRRVLAMTEIRFSNSLIEAWWRSLKHQWLFLHRLDSAAGVRRLVELYVGEHNARVPHAAFEGQTPDEMYFGTGDHVPGELAAAKAEARRRRLEVNRAAVCGVCA